ncbi:hypothetical protein RND81_06G021300 [Saponaria officinalis]|uniref:Uncharacterized protein n=1 Tax=Saponaria officinalis TaxID=3572 RepID=A0AAW1K5G3_SAPOF
MMNDSKMMKKLKLNGEFLHQFSYFKNTSTYSPCQKNNVEIDKIVTKRDDLGDFISATTTREYIYVTNNNNRQVYVEGAKLKLKGADGSQDRTKVTPGSPGQIN